MGGSTVPITMREFGARPAGSRSTNTGRDLAQVIAINLTGRVVVHEI